MAIYPNAVVRFHASDMILRADINASYLTEPEACSRDAGYFFLGSIPSKCAREFLNWPIHVNCNILKFVAASAAKAETKGCFVTGRYVTILQNKLEEMATHISLHKYVRKIRQPLELRTIQSSHSNHEQYI